MRMLQCWPDLRSLLDIYPSFPKSFPAREHLFFTGCNRSHIIDQGGKDNTTLMLLQFQMMVGSDLR